MTDPSLSPEIDSCRFLFLREIQELQAKSKSLRLTLVEGLVGSEVVPLRVGPTDFDDLRPIQVGAASRWFEIHWERYIAYSVRDESYMTETEDEVLQSGRWIRVYEKSNFLDYVNKATWEDPFYSSQVKHVSVWTLTHIIDIAFVQFPSISRITPPYSM